MRAEDRSRATNLSVAASAVSFDLPPALFESIARRVVEILAEEGRANVPASLPEFLNVDETAEYLRCNRQRVYDLLSSRRLPRCKDGARVLVRRTDLDAYIASQS